MLLMQLLNSTLFRPTHLFIPLLVLLVTLHCYNTYKKRTPSEVLVIYKIRTEYIKCPLQIMWLSSRPSEVKVLKVHVNRKLAASRDNSDKGANSPCHQSGRAHGQGKCRCIPRRGWTDSPGHRAAWHWITRPRTTLPRGALINRGRSRRCCGAGGNRSASSCGQ